MANRDHYAEFLAAECKDIETPSWLLVERAFEAGQAAAKNNPSAETSADGPCQEADGCPTELVVLKRFWRAHQSTPSAESAPQHQGSHEGFTAGHVSPKVGPLTANEDSTPSGGATESCRELVKRLRSTRATMLGTEDEAHFADCHEAADVIERLTAQAGAPVAWRYKLAGDLQWQYTERSEQLIGQTEPLYLAPPSPQPPKVENSDHE